LENNIFIKYIKIYVNTVNIIKYIVLFPLVFLFLLPPHPLPPLKFSKNI
jgi:hypothetical protein